MTVLPISSLTEIPLGECSLFSSESLVERTGLGPSSGGLAGTGSLSRSVSWDAGPLTRGQVGAHIFGASALGPGLPAPAAAAPAALPGLGCGLRQPSRLLWASWGWREAGLDQAPRSRPGVPNTDFSPGGSWRTQSPLSLEVSPRLRVGAQGGGHLPRTPFPSSSRSSVYLFTAAPANRLLGNVLILHDPILARSLIALVPSLLGGPTWTPARKALGPLAGGGPAPPVDSEYVGWGPALSRVELGCPGGGRPPSPSRVSCLPSPALSSPSLTAKSPLPCLTAHVGAPGTSLLPDSLGQGEGGRAAPPPQVKAETLGGRDRAGRAGAGLETCGPQAVTAGAPPGTWSWSQQPGGLVL